MTMESLSLICDGCGRRYYKGFLNILGHFCSKKCFKKKEAMKTYIVSYYNNGQEHAVTIRAQTVDEAFFIARGQIKWSPTGRITAVEEV